MCTSSISPMGAVGYRNEHAGAMHGLALLALIWPLDNWILQLPSDTTFPSSTHAAVQLATSSCTPAQRWLPMREGAGAHVTHEGSGLQHSPGEDEAVSSHQTELLQLLALLAQPPTVRLLAGLLLHALASTSPSPQLGLTPGEEDAAGTCQQQCPLP